MNIAQRNRARFTEKISLKLRFLRTNPACLVEGIEEDLSITRFANVVSMLTGTTKVFEVGLMIHRCLVTHSVSKYKGGNGLLQELILLATTLDE